MKAHFRFNNPTILPVSSLVAKEKEREREKEKESQNWNQNAHTIWIADELSLAKFGTLETKRNEMKRDETNRIETKPRESSSILGELNQAFSLLVWFSEE